MSALTPAPAPKSRRLRRFAVAACALALLAALVPGSPVHVSEWFALAPRADGRTARQWARDLESASTDARGTALVALGSLGAPARFAVPRIAEVLSADPDPRTRAAAADALRKIGATDEPTVRALGAALADASPLVRASAAQALARLGAGARPAVPELLAAAGDEDNDTDVEVFSFTVRDSVLAALGPAAAGSPDAVPAFVEVLTRPAPNLSRALAARGIGLAGEHGRAHAPLLRALLRDPNGEVRTAAGEALAALGQSREGPTHKSPYDGLELPAAEQKRLWELEHRGNLLNKFGFEPLAAALAKADAAALAAFLAPGFAGTEPDGTNRTATTGFARVERVDPGARESPLARGAFVERLLELRRKCGPTATAKLAMATVSPKPGPSTAGAWEGTALLRVFGTGPAGPAEVTATLAFEIDEPTEQRFATGGWLRAARLRRYAVAAAPHAMFTECAKARGLTAELHDNWLTDSRAAVTGGAYVADFDRDGYLDVLVTDLTGTTLYRGGPGGKFADVTDAVGLPRAAPWDAVCAAWVDLDNDGWDDLILGQQVFRNVRGKFEDYTARTSLRVPPDLTGIVVADYDRDGRIDLYFTRAGVPGNLSWLEGRSASATGNRLMRNKGDWQFEDATKKSGTRGGYRSTFTAGWFDADNDGWPDLLVPNEFGDAVLYVNNRDGTFKPRALADRPVDFGTMGLALGDVNNDGHIDVYSANMYSKAGTRVIGNMKPDAYPPAVMEKFRRFVAGSQLHLNKGELKFDSVGAEKQLATVGWAYGAALADLDGDGLLDVYATAGYISVDRTKPDG